MKSVNTSRIQSSTLLSINPSNNFFQELEFKTHSQENTFKKFEIISDKNKQYSRRSSLRIEVTEFKESDAGDNMEEIQKCCNVMCIPFTANEIDRAHDIRKSFLDKELKKKVRSMIVKFKSSRSATLLDTNVGLFM